MVLNISRFEVECVVNSNKSPKEKKLVLLYLFKFSTLIGTEIAQRANLFRAASVKDFKVNIV